MGSRATSPMPAVRTAIWPKMAPSPVGQRLQRSRYALQRFPPHSRTTAPRARQKGFLKTRDRQAQGSPLRPLRREKLCHQSPTVTSTSGMHCRERIESLPSGARMRGLCSSATRSSAIHVHVVIMAVGQQDKINRRQLLIMQQQADNGGTVKVTLVVIGALRLYRIDQNVQVCTMQQNRGMPDNSNAKSCDASVRCQAAPRGNNPGPSRAFAEQPPT